MVSHEMFFPKNYLKTLFCRKCEIGRRFTQENRKVNIFSAPSEFCHKTLILQLKTYLMSTEINVADVQLGGSICHT